MSNKYIFTLLTLLVRPRSNTGRVTTGSVQHPLLSWGAECLRSGNTSGRRGEALSSTHASTLDSQSLAHDRATTGQNLEVRHSATSSAGSRSGRQSAQSRGGRALEEWAHSTRLLKHGLHDCKFYRTMQQKNNVEIEPKVSGENGTRGKEL